MRLVAWLAMSPFLLAAAVLAAVGAVAITLGAASSACAAAVADWAFALIGRDA